MSDNDSSSSIGGTASARSVDSSERSASGTLYALIEDVLKEKRRARRWRIFFRLIWLLIIIAIIAAIFLRSLGSSVGNMSAGSYVGVVDLKGVISNDSDASADRVIKGLDDAWEGSSKAVILRINSPGGTPVQAQRIYAEVLRLRAKGTKPVYAVIEDIGASGAYYAASAATKIYAAPASLVGSIGVISSSFGFQDIMKRYGIERRVFTAGQNKDMMDPFRPVSPEQGEFWQKLLDTTHQQFINDVKAGRGERLGSDPQMFSGLVWSGEQAKRLGLVDEVRNFDEVVRQLTGDTSKVVDYTPSIDPFDRLSRKIGVVASSMLGLDEMGGGSPLRAEYR